MAQFSACSNMDKALRSSVSIKNCVRLPKGASDAQDGH